MYVYVLEHICFYISNPLAKKNKNKKQNKTEHTTQNKSRDSIITKHSETRTKHFASSLPGGARNVSRNNSLKHK